ncbi:HNH endonuclease [Stenotrophomonas sp. ZAC14D2_NAIMI4_7]|nr:HNH endonuclease [Stenotrophomonas sp. ZAC14D2_NAIMI4_7]
MGARLSGGSDLEKAKVYRELSARHGRSIKAWEYRMQNISHVLEQAGESWLPGLRPAANVGAKVETQLARLLARTNDAPTAVYGPTRELLEQEARTAQNTGAFTPGDEVDERERVLAAIVRRRGQPEFRRALIGAFGGRCAMTGCDAVDALEAAHIIPYRNSASNDVSNGLLLRADIHTLFDLYLIGVDSAQRQITVAPSLMGSAYKSLQGAGLAAPCLPDQMTSAASLDWHRFHCNW